jgi:hypothetical protein
MKIKVSKLLPVALTIAAFTPFAAYAQPVYQSQPHYTHSELKQLMHDAHTPQQYQALALYFRSQQQRFNDKALAEKAEWYRRSEITAPPVVKAGTANDARSLYIYYTSKATEMAALASDYEQRSQ